jgi:hypothetical protein
MGDMGSLILFSLICPGACGGNIAVISKIGARKVRAADLERNAQQGIGVAIVQGVAKFSTGSSARCRARFSFTLRFLVGSVARVRRE